MKLFVIVAFSCFSLATSSIVKADSASHRKKAKELLELMYLKQNSLEKLQSTMTKSLESTYKEFETSPESKDIYDRYVQETQTIVAQHMSFGGVMDLFVERFAQNYTEDEIDELLKFHKSPLGRKYRSETPESNEKFKDRMGALVTENSEGLGEVFTGMNRRLQALTQDLAK